MASQDPVLREHSKQTRNRFTDELKARGFKSGLPYAMATNRVYTGLFGTNASGLRARYGTDGSVRDAMPPADLALTVLTEDQVGDVLSRSSLSVSGAIDHVTSVLTSLTDQCKAIA